MISGGLMKSEEKREFIIRGSMYKVIIALATPIMFNNLIQTMYSVINAYFLGRLGYVEFAATSFVWPVNFLFISLGMGISIAGTSILSQLLGASKHEDANKYASQLVVISFIASIVFALIGYALSPIIVGLMGASGDLKMYGSIYLKITFLELPFMFFFFNFNSIMNSQGNTLTPTILSAISAVLNGVLDPIFIFTLKMGVAGAAYATLVAKGLLAFAGLIILFRSSSAIRPKLKGFRFDRKIIMQLMKVAIPSSIGQSGSALGFMVLNSFIVSYGTATMAAFGLVNRITSLVMQPSMGIGAALTAIVGQNLGSDQACRVKEAFKKSIIVAMYVSIIGSLLMLWKDNEMINLFIKSDGEAEVISQSIVYLWYVSFSMPLMGIFSILQGIFQGSGHTKYSMAMEIGRLWFVRLPMILLFKHFTSIGAVGIWFSMGFSNLIICIYGYLVYRKGNWQDRIIG
jgi:putative MATE family efflux protein